MDEQDRWDYINSLDEEMLKGGVMLSEWTSFLVRDAEIAFTANANLASVLACQAAIEAHLRFDWFPTMDTSKWGFYLLIENAPLDAELKCELHELRKFRNKWVHVKDPVDDQDLLERPEFHEENLSRVAIKSIKTMLKTIYTNQFI